MITPDLLFAEQSAWAKSNGATKNFSSPRELHHQLIRWQLSDWVYDRANALAQEYEVSRGALRRVGENCLTDPIVNFYPTKHGEDLREYVEPFVEAALMAEVDRLKLNSKSQPRHDIRSGPPQKLRMKK